MGNRYGRVAFRGHVHQKAVAKIVMFGLGLPPNGIFQQPSLEQNPPTNKRGFSMEHLCSCYFSVYLFIKNTAFAISFIRHSMCDKRFLSSSHLHHTSSFLLYEVAFISLNAKPTQPPVLALI